jgi:hypothetical protein
LELPAPPSDAPSTFRCAKDGMMAELLANAGFKNIAIEVVPGTLKAQTIDLYWEMMNEVAAPVVAAMKNADAAQKEKIKAEVSQALAEKYPEGYIELESSALIIYAEKEQFEM